MPAALVDKRVDNDGDISKEDNLLCKKANKKDIERMKREMMMKMQEEVEKERKKEMAKMEKEVMDEIGNMENQIKNMRNDVKDNMDKMKEEIMEAIVD